MILTSDTQAHMILFILVTCSCVTLYICHCNFYSTVIIPFLFYLEKCSGKILRDGPNKKIIIMISKCGLWRLKWMVARQSLIRLV